MYKQAFFVFALASWILQGSLWAVEITTTFVDGLGRPLRGVTVEVKYPKKGPDEKLKEVEWLKTISDQEGKITITYDETLVPTNETVWFSVKKPHYSGFSTDLLKSQYTLKHQFSAEDIHRVAKLSGPDQKAELGEILVGEFKAESEHQTLKELVFFYGNEFRPVLRELVEDTNTGKEACSLLAFIAMPEDIRFILKNAPVPKRKLYEDRWAYQVVCALLQPETPEEWDFLKRCAADEYYDRWVDAGAIRTLRLIGSPQSADILREAAKQNVGRKESFTHALAAISKGPFSLEAADLQDAGNKVAQAIKVGDWQFNTEPMYNKAKNMALVDCKFIAGRDLLIETATFHKVGDIWKLRGVRETMQVLLANPPEAERFVGTWQGFSENQIEFARLELKQDGTGLLAVSFLPDSVPEKYIVTRWSLKEQLELVIKPGEPGAEPVTMENLKLGSDVLQFVLRPVHGGDWHCRLKLFNEKTFQARSNAAKKALEALQTKP
jgi:hypothetical protein